MEVQGVQVQERRAHRAQVRAAHPRLGEQLSVFHEVNMRSEVKLFSVNYNKLSESRHCKKSHNLGQALSEDSSCILYI